MNPRAPGAGLLPGLRLRSLARNLVAGARLALLLPVRAVDFRATTGDVVVLCAFNFAVWLLASAARAGFPGALDTGVVAGQLAIIPLVLAAAFAIAALVRQRGLAPLVAVALVAGDALLELAGAVLLSLPAESAAFGTLSVLYLVWKWLVALRAVIVCAGTRRPEIFQGALVVTAMTAILVAWPAGSPWIGLEEEEPEPAALMQERNFHLQGELIEQALAGIARGRPGVPELYFVGFAPDGSQDVFLREMRFVHSLFDERFGTRGRSVVLANGDAALNEFPLASATNLRRVLAQFARQMNTEEDAVMVYLSAHGDAQHLLSALQPPLDLESIGPTALARMLQDAGIRWKIIVISACFSGGFVEPLKDDNTLIVTASAADRHSFGCETGEDFTWFGRAYFNDALARTRSFVEAYALARGAVARQEAAEGVDASLPQIWVGRAIESRLPAWEGRRSAK